MEFFNSKLRPNQCKFEIMSLKVMEMVSNYKLKIKHMVK